MDNWNGTLAEYPADWLPHCIQIANLLGNKSIEIIIDCHLVLAGATMVAIIILLQQYIRHKIVLHPNLLLLFANTIFLYFLYLLTVFAEFFRYRILLFSYKHPCELLTPVWMVPFFIGPNFMYVLAFPAFHFFIMVERIRATFMAKKYEQEGVKFGIKGALLIWTVSLCYMIFVIVSALADTETFAHPQGLVTLTTKYNSTVNLYVAISTMPLVIVTAIGDAWITVINRQAKKHSQANFEQYSLTRNYQLNENALTMRLILPLDIAYACLYSLYQTLIIIIRAYLSSHQLTTNDYIFYYYLINTILYIYMAIAIIVYIQFVRYVNRRKVFTVNKILPAQNDETNAYFKQLNTQWA